MTQTKFNASFARDVLNGLSKYPKSLSSKYFYDDAGSRIFQKIMHMPEYYLTNCEYEIFESSKDALCTIFSEGQKAFDIVELGAGDGYKTTVLLKHFLSCGIHFKYIPIDISAGALETLNKKMQQELPDLEIHSKKGDYFKVMNELQQYDSDRKILLFLGSNIGNFNEQQSVDFFKQVAAVMTPNDYLFIGFDLKKEPAVIQKAYDDPHGYTREFNLNLLNRINSELGGAFNLNAFSHYALYDPQSGAAKSYLISNVDQEVEVRHLNRSFKFNAWETIYMERSQKYDERMIEALAGKCGFEIRACFYDRKHFFSNVLWQLK